MTHDECRAALNAWHDGEVDAETARSIEAHVGRCDACRREAMGLRMMSSALKELPGHVLPAEVRASIRTGARRTPRAGWSPWSIASLASAAVLLLLIAVGVSRIETPVVQPGTPRIAGGEATMKHATESGAGSEQAAPKTLETPEPPPGSSRRSIPQTPESPVVSSAGEEDDHRADDSRSGVAPEATSMPQEARNDVQALGPAPTPHPEPPPVARESKEAFAPVPASALGDVLATIYRASIVHAPDGGYSLAMTASPTLSKSDAARAAPAEPEASSRTSGAPGAAPPGDTRGGRQEEAGAMPDRQAPPPGTTVLFLIALDAEGRIVEASPVGARVLAPERIDRVRALLIGATVPGPAPGRPIRTTCEVAVPVDFSGF